MNVAVVLPASHTEIEQFLFLQNKLHAIWDIDWSLLLDIEKGQCPLQFDSNNLVIQNTCSCCCQRGNLVTVLNAGALNGIQFIH